MQLDLTEILKGIPQIELSYRTGIPADSMFQITCPKDSVDVFRQNWDANKIEFIEQFKVLLVNRNNRVLGIFEVSTGGIASTVVDIRLILSAALLACASGIILAHNHPSGNLKPSQADKLATLKIKEAAKLIEIALLDHVILTKEGYFSFAEDGELY